jgi:hypothetical protein
MLIIILLSTLPVILFVRFSGHVVRPAVGISVYIGLAAFGLLLWRLVGELLFQRCRTRLTSRRLDESEIKHKSGDGRV